MPQKIILSRTDNLGDVVVTLPLAGYLKQVFPTAQIGFIGKKYTQPIIEHCRHVDFFLDRENVLQHPEQLQADCIIFVFPDKELAQIAKKQGIQLRIGTSHRWFHWLYCNKLVNFSRKNSPLHEAQLNFQLLSPLQIRTVPPLAELANFYGLFAPENGTLPIHIDKNKQRIILHPKSKGSAREWSLEHYEQLIQLLSPEKYQIFITGVAQEGEQIRQQRPSIFDYPHVTDTTGRLSLPELMTLFVNCHAFVACSTGTLHIAAALGLKTIGIYPPIRPMHPARWQPVGKQATFLVEQKNCEACRKTQQCACINAITPLQVRELLK
jgi:ADP-heptose:LPS heptosyltransferase